MKLYMHPVSTTSRPVMQFIADNDIACEMEVVDILKGEHYEPAYSKINPNRLMPMLEDGDFRLTESAAILRYLAEKIGLARLSQGPQAARPGQRGDGLVQLQLLPRLGLWPDLSAALPAPQARGRQGAGGRRCLGQGEVQGLAAGAERPLASARKNKYLCGNEITIADYFGAAIVTAGELVHCDLSAYPNVKRWLDTMKKRPSYAKVYETLQRLLRLDQGPALAGDLTQESMP